MSSESAVGRRSALASVVLLELTENTLTAALCERVEGRFRFLVGSGEVSIMHSDPIMEAVQNVERLSGRRLLAGSVLVAPERPDGAGVDGVLLAADERVRVAIIAPTALSASAAVAGVDPAIADLVFRLELDADRARNEPFLGHLVKLMTSQPPELVIVPGGTEDSGGDAALVVARALAMAMRATRASRPTIIFAGNWSLRERFAAALAGSTVEFVANVLPRLDTIDCEALARRLRAEWIQRQRTSRLHAGLTRPPTPRLEALTNALQILARWKSAPVWGVDAQAQRIDVIRAEPGDAIAVSRILETTSASAPPARRWGAETEAEATEIRQTLAASIAEAAASLKLGGKQATAPALLVGRGAGLIDRLPAADASWALAHGLGLNETVPTALDRLGLLAGAGALLGIAPAAAADLVYDALDWVDATDRTRGDRSIVDRSNR